MLRDPESLKKATRRISLGICGMVTQQPRSGICSVVLFSCPPKVDRDKRRRLLAYGHEKRILDSNEKDDSGQRYTHRRDPSIRQNGYPPLIECIKFPSSTAILCRTWMKTKYLRYCGCFKLHVERATASNGEDMRQCSMTCRWPEVRERGWAGAFVGEGELPES
jgi:hypothetical protein